MNLFQIIALVVLAALVLNELVRGVRRPVAWSAHLIRAAVWLAAAVAIAFPELPNAVAKALGIGRGADVVLYVLALAFVGVSFALYSRIVHLRRQMTDIVRHLALERPLPPARVVSPLGKDGAR